MPIVINQFSLLTKRRFLPLFITQFLNAFNDNVFKNALVVLITYMIADRLTVSSNILVTLTGCLLILPMFLFSAQAGSIADKFEKSRLVQWIKIVEIILMLIGAIGFITQNVVLLMIILFLLGTQATFFGPIKYSILPFHLKKEELVAGNGLIEMGTFLAILLGNILGVIFIAMSQGLYIISGMIILFAICGYTSSCFIPKAPPPSPELHVSLNLFKETYNIVQFSRQDTVNFLCILGISWFWLIGFTFLAQFPNYAKDFMGADSDVFVLFLALFSIGVGVGSGLCNRILKGQIKATYVPLAAFGISLFTLDLYLATQHELGITHPPDLLTVAQFLQSWNHLRISLDMFLIALCGGIYIVPLYTILQHRAPKKHKARLIASNNIMNALFMTVAAIVTMIMLKMQMTIPHIFLTIAMINLIVMLKIRRIIKGR